MNSNMAYQEQAWDELIDGKVVMMSPRPSVNHHIVANNIYLLFRSYLKGKTCRPFGDGVDLYLTEKDRFIPDVMVVCDRSKIHPNGVHGAPDLVVEVISPGTARNDRGKKMKAYEGAGVREYWLVNVAEKSVEQYFLEDSSFELHDIYTVYPDYMLEVMDEEERAAVVTKFRCSLYKDLEITLDDIFEDTF